jgi:superfamily II DNA or RNA helicase
MLIFKRTSGIIIPTEYKNEKWYQFIKKKLTRRFKDYNTSTYTVYKFYIEGEKFLKIPRFFPIHDYLLCKIEDKINDGEDIEIEHSIILRDELQRNTVEYMLSHDMGIIQCPPGSGKTILSIYIIATLKKKTLILTHRTSLIDQWMGVNTEGKKQGFLNFTNIDINDMGKLTSSNFKEVLKKKIILCTDQTFISLLKRNRQEFLIELNHARIHTLIVDELHTAVGAPTFSECSLHLPVKRVYGLSATPFHENTNDIMQMHCGPIIIPEGKSSTMDARVVVLLFDYEIVQSRKRYIYWAGKFQRSRYLNMIKNSKPFMKIAIGLLNKFISEDRNIIFMAERIKLIDELYNKTNTEDKTKFISGAGNEVLSKKIIFTTPGRFRDGVDCPEKNLLIMSSPINNVDQMTGRILRISKDKIEPLVMDLVDISCVDISRTLLKRLEFYKLKNWNIRYLYVDSNGNKNELEEEQVIKLLSEE